MDFFYAQILGSSVRATLTTQISVGLLGVGGRIVG